MFSINEETLGDRRRNERFHPSSNHLFFVLPAFDFQNRPVNVEVEIRGDFVSFWMNPILASDTDRIIAQFWCFHVEFDTNFHVAVIEFTSAREGVCEPSTEVEVWFVFPHFHAFFPVESEVKCIEYGGFPNPVFSRNHVDLSFASKWDPVFTTKPLEVFNMNRSEGNHGFSPPNAL